MNGSHDRCPLRREAAEARVSALETQIAFEVARAYAAVIAADRRAALADDAARAFEQARTVSETTSPRATSVNSLVARAAARRADLKALELDAAAASADAQLARRERTPVPTLSAGPKLERAPGAGSRAGFVAGVSIPLPNMG